MSDNDCDDNWVIKIEYCCDKNTSYVDESCVRELDECPCYDPEKIYKAFWSPIDGDTPSAMLEKVPKIPMLTEKEQKECKAGYYDAVILGIKRRREDFEIKRTSKLTSRGKHPDKHEKRKSNSIKPAGSKRIDGKNCKLATEKNLEPRLQRDQKSVFASLDDEIELGNGNETGHDSDSSVSDPSSVSVSQLKVLKSSLKNLRKKLLEKCAQVDALQKDLKKRDEELHHLRDLNRKYQEVLLDRVTPSSMSLNSSRSSSLTSVRSLSASPLCPRSRSVSTSSSCSGLSHHAATPASPNFSPTPSPLAKRKTPPSTPATGSKRALKSLDPTTNNILDKKEDGLNKSFEDNPMSRTGSFEANSSSNTLVDDSLMDTSEVVDSGPSPEVEADQMEKENKDTVDFCKGFPVDKEKLKQVEARALGKVNDATYVKELAVLVYGLKVLYNSSLSERKYSRAEEEQNKKTRKKLDDAPLKEITERVKKRVVQEFKGLMVPNEDATRYKASTINRFIYDKIKKMRQNKNFAYLDDAN